MPMNPNDEKIEELMQRLNQLVIRQKEFEADIKILQFEIYRLQSAESVSPVHIEPAAVEPVPEPEPTPKVTQITTLMPVESAYILENQEFEDGYVDNASLIGQIAKSSIEKFIGENLISKIGILITVLGVGIGAKYAIEHQLISPVTRVLLGYLFGGALLAVALKLKPKYENFSAVLLSGGIAISYFITYLAFSLYGFFPHLLAFAIMVVLTLLSVVAAIWYNRQVIAHFGLVGAYAVPFLLSYGEGNPATLFTYMTIINVGILAITIKKYWKPLFFSVIGITWLIYLSWISADYNSSNHFSIAIIFSVIFFVLFYASLIGYKIWKNEPYDVENISILLTNAFVFYGVGYYLLNNNVLCDNLLGLFTIMNSLIHSVASFIIFRQKTYDRNLLYITGGLALLFFTITIPIQLDGSWVTLLWAGEALLLFWVARVRRISFYEILSYSLMVLAFFSITKDWSTFYGSFVKGDASTWIIPLLNTMFMVSMLVVAMFGYIVVLNEKYSTTIKSQGMMLKFSTYAIPAIFVVLVYFSFITEISNYWKQLYIDSHISIIEPGNNYPTSFFDDDFKHIGKLWRINYSLLFFSIMVVVAFKKFNSQVLRRISSLFILLALAFFLLDGVVALQELRENYVTQYLGDYYTRSANNIIIRYVSLVFVATALFVIRRFIRDRLGNQDFSIHYDIVLNITLLVVVSSELLQWMDVLGVQNSDKLGLSILWGLYSLILIVAGIKFKKKHLRIGAMSLFGITLLKLFFYDISHLNTISKTIVMVSLGILLLVISFLYNKYKNVITD